MSRNRFEKLGMMIIDNFGMREREDPKYDKIFKTRSFINSLHKKFQKLNRKNIIQSTKL